MHETLLYTSPADLETTLIFASRSGHTSATTLIEERRKYSQNGEDGVLQSLFSAIGTTDRQYVEIGCEDGAECNTRALREAGWRGWMFDAANENRHIGLTKTFVTRENAASLLASCGVPAAFDLLSLDINFNDFHVLDAVLHACRPRVLVVEYNASLGSQADAVVPYLPTYGWDGTNWFGASFRAMCALGTSHGYIPVYCESQGVNLFLVHRSAWGQRPVPDPQALFRAPAYGPTGNGHPKDPQDRPFLTSEHYLLEGVARSETRFGPISYLAGDEYIARSFAAGGYWEEAEICAVAQHLRDADGVAIDAGAHIGSHTIALSKLCPGLEFICFEPQRPLRLLLERNLAENGVRHRVAVSDMAVAHASCQTALATTFSDGSSAGQQISYGTGGHGNYGGVQLGIEGPVIEAMPLDALCSMKIAYLKLDVEGAERIAMFGARQLLAQHKPIVLFEHRGDRRLSAEVIRALAVPREAQDFDCIRYLQALGMKLAPLGRDLLATPERSAGTAARTVAISTTASPQPLSVSGWTQDDETPSTRCTTTVPPLVFHCGTDEPDSLPALDPDGSTYLECHPGLRFRPWAIADGVELVRTYFSWLVDFLDQQAPPTVKRGVGRVLGMYLHGGIWSSSRSLCLQPMYELFGSSELRFARSGVTGRPHCDISMATVASPPRHPFWLLALGRLIEKSSRDHSSSAATTDLEAVISKCYREWMEQPEQAVRVIRLIEAEVPQSLRPIPGAAGPICSDSHWLTLDAGDAVHNLLARELLAQPTGGAVNACRRLWPDARVISLPSRSAPPAPSEVA
jgi:FkbM family methyltransferase